MILAVDDQRVAAAFVNGFRDQFGPGLVDEGPLNRHDILKRPPEADDGVAQSGAERHLPSPQQHLEAQTLPVERGKLAIESQIPCRVQNPLRRLGPYPAALVQNPIDRRMPDAGAPRDVNEFPLHTPCRLCSNSGRPA